jgi:hypothetical protein
MTRKEANLEIIRLIYAYVENYPDQRFGQILQNIDVVRRSKSASTLEDEYYLESEELLKRVVLSILADDLST